MKIKIHVDLKQPQQKYIHVRYDVSLSKEECLKKKFVIHFPAWTPGSYLVRDFAGHVEAFAAFVSTKKRLKHQKLSKSTWEIATEGQENFSFSYQVYANDLSVRAAYADHEFVFFNTPAVFFYPDVGTQHPVSLKIQTPAKWQLALAKKPRQGVYSFQSFDEFFDTPVLASDQLQMVSFQIVKNRYKMAIFGDHTGEIKKIVSDLKRILKSQLKIFKDSPCSEYLFQVLFLKGHYGGLEHSFSSTNIFDGTALKDKKRYPNFLSLLAHEHFHLWNVKRIRPKALGPFDYSQENYTRELWIAEGITSYYDDHTTYRGGIYSQEEYLAVLTRNLARYESSHSSQVNSLSDSSFDAWIRFYKQNENSINRTVSYYLKGGLVMMLLDFRMILESAGKYNLDHVMRRLYDLYKKRPQLGITRDEFFAVVSSFTKKDYRSFIKNYIDGVASIDWKKEFSPFGIELKEEKKSLPYSAGFHLKDQNGSVVIDKIAEKSPAYNSILQSGDEILAVDRLRVKTAKMVKDLDFQKQTHLIFARRGKVYEENLKLSPGNIFRKKLVIKKNLTQKEKKFLNIFLRK